MNDRWNGTNDEDATLERALRAVRAEANPAVLTRALARLEHAPPAAVRIAAWLMRPASAWSAAALLVVSLFVSYGMLQSARDTALAPHQVVNSLLEDDETLGLPVVDDETAADSGSVS